MRCVERNIAFAHYMETSRVAHESINTELQSWIECVSLTALFLRLEV